MTTKRPISLDKKLPMNLTVQIPYKNDRKRSDYGMVENIRNDFTNKA